MDTHMYTKLYNSAFLGSYCSFVMKDLVKKMIVLQMQTAPSRLQPASAQCFLDAMILLHPGITRMRNTLHCLYRQAWHFKTSEFHRDRNKKYAIVTRRPIHSYAK